MAGREKLNNLVFVINCNLQRLDGPVRGNGKIIQELESEFRGSGWNVIKLVWGRKWDTLFARDKKAYWSNVWVKWSMANSNHARENAQYIRDTLFNTPELKEKLVADWDDDDIWALQSRRPRSVQNYAAFKAARIG